MPLTTSWLRRLLLFVGLFLPTVAFSSRLEIRPDTLPREEVQRWPIPTSSAQTEPKRRTHPLALVSLGAAIAGFVCAREFPASPVLALAGWGIAVVTGLISYKRIKRRRTYLKGQGWALAGLGIGLLSIVTMLAFVLTILFLLSRIK